MIPRKKKKPTHEELEGFDININELGELESTIDIDKINAFLNKNLEDKKIPDEEDTPLEEKDMLDDDDDDFEDDPWEEE